MPDYTNGKIYSIRSHQTDQIYIGSTVEKLSARMSKHRYSYKRFKAGKGNFTTSYTMLDYPDVYIELIENFPCACRGELERVEGQHIRAEPNSVNKCIAGRTQTEYYQDNVEKIKDKNKQYYQDNTEKIKDQMKQYRQDNTEKFKQYQKQYRQDNTGKFKQYQKQYRQDNAEKIKD